jgi:hypothetical protein
LNCKRECVAFGFVEQQVNVFRHDYVAINAENVVQAHSFECLEKSFACMFGCQVRAAAITTERKEMNSSGFLEAL